EITDRAGVRGVARRAPADASGLRTLNGLVHRPRHADSGRRTIGFQHHRGCRLALDPDIRLGVDRTRVDQIDVARNADGAMRVGAAQIGPDQHLGPFGRVFARQPDRDKDRGDEFFELGFADADVVLGHCRDYAASLLPATDLYQSRICAPFQWSTPG